MYPTCTPGNQEGSLLGALSAKTKPMNTREVKWHSHFSNACKTWKKFILKKPSLTFYIFVLFKVRTDLI